MRTRRGICYTGPQRKAESRSLQEKDEEELRMSAKRRRRRQLPDGGGAAEAWTNKEGGSEDLGAEKHDMFDGLPDDLVVLILCNLSAAASSPSDLISVLITSKRLNRLGSSPLVLSKASAESLAVRAKNWAQSVHRFLKLCADAGNLEACYILGMILFYCVPNRSSGASLIERAALSGHTEALYSLAVIQFNGSGGTRKDKDLRSGVAFCARAAFLGHIGALRELGHCLHDGYGVRRNIVQGRRLLVQANVCELAAVAKTTHTPFALLNHHRRNVPASRCFLLSDVGYNVPAAVAHPANRFMMEWFAARGIGTGSEEDELRLCSHNGCGRPETRWHEFRRCSACANANYCSRACQTLHWKLAHKVECAPTELLLGAAAADPAPPVADGAGAAMH